jgi:hypothetical protein
MYQSAFSSAPPSSSSKPFVWHHSEVRACWRVSIFGVLKPSWTPVFDEHATLQLSEGDQSLVSRLELIPPEDKEWLLVTDLRPSEEESSEYQKALIESSPESGGYVLISQRRRKKDDQTKER